MSLKITPSEIRQKSFEKVLRGYDKDEVTAFLVTLSKEWEKIIEENKELKSQIENAQKEIVKLREAESALLQSINDSENSNNQLVEQVTQAAEVQFRESQINAEAFIQEARIKARNLVEEAELEAQQILGGIEKRLKELIADYKGLSQHRQGLTGQYLKAIEELNEKTMALSQLHSDFEPEALLAEFRAKAKDTEEAQRPSKENSEARKTIHQSSGHNETENKSFFDTIL
ncbi:MAG: DivIVA domain-containing protein [Bacteroidetes bacterium]|nr:DivIVA domain-containing protein [Bacteroidota bacterium]